MYLHTELATFEEFASLGKDLSLVALIEPVSTANILKGYIGEMLEIVKKLVTVKNNFEKMKRNAYKMIEKEVKSEQIVLRDTENSPENRPESARNPLKNPTKSDDFRSFVLEKRIGKLEAELIVLKSAYKSVKHENSQLRQGLHHAHSVLTHYKSVFSREFASIPDFYGSKGNERVPSDVGGCSESAKGVKSQYRLCIVESKGR